MYLIIHTIPVKPNSGEVAKAMFEEKIPPLAERFSAWRGARLCTTDDNQLVSIGVWADQAQMREFLTQPDFELAMASFSAIFTGPPTTLITEELTSVGPA